MNANHTWHLFTLRRTLSNLVFYWDVPAQEAASIGWRDSVREDVQQCFAEAIESEVIARDTLTARRTDALTLVSILHANAGMTRSEWGPDVPNAVKNLRQFCDQLETLEHIASDEGERATEPEKPNATGAVEGDDTAGYVMASTIWKGRFTRYPDFRKFLDSHPEIPTKPKGKQRLLVHAAKCLEVLAKMDQAAFNRLDDTEHPEVVPGTVDNATYLENVGKLYREVNASKKPKK